VSPPLQVAQTPVDYRSYAVYSCVPGYLLVGDSKRECLNGATLDGVEPTCALIYCPDLSATSPLSVSVSNLTYAFNGVATYTCVIGYYLSGSSTRLCQADGTWSGSRPTCSIVTCPSLTPTSPLAVNVSEYTYISNGVATYTCATGYSMTGSNQRTCQVDGTWSGSEPTCSIVTCPLLSVTSPLSVSALNITYNSDVTYSCEIGYFLSGFDTRTCQSDGSWSESEPTCSLVTCPALSTTFPLSVNAPNITYNSIATYYCATSHYLLGSNSSTCQADGTWSGPEPSCSVVTCPSLSTTFPLSVSAQALSYDSNASYVCATGFRVNGTNTRTCQSDGIWSDVEPFCTPITCPTITPPINGQVNFPSGFGVGGEAVFGCNPGYILSDDRTATCTVAGTWNITRPSCLYHGMICFICLFELLFLL